MKIKEIISCLESFAPLSYQESYDNSGLITGDPGQSVESVLLSIDVTEDVINEAISLGSGMIISHHPILFSAIKKLTGDHYVERCIIKAIRNDIALYAMHTNADSVREGVNRIICGKIGLQNTRILLPRQEELRKLVFFVPPEHAHTVREKIFEAGAGVIGNYDRCSFNLTGEGTFRALEGTDPYVGKKGELHTEKEIRVETLFPKHRQSAVIAALLEAHPYEEVAYDLYMLDNQYDGAGMGMIGQLPEPVDEKYFLDQIKNKFSSRIIRHSRLLKRKIQNVAVCGGSGSSLLKEAISQGADIFLTADLKYHQFFDADGRIVLADIGHYESEQFTTELFHDILLKNFHNFAVHFSKVNTNPVNYF
jgi:dinuclear metal center YbgI/SA1388 family protein